MKVKQKKKRKYINPKTKRTIKRKLIFYASVLVSGLFFAFLIWLSALPQFNIHKIKVDGKSPIAWRLQKYLHDKIFLKDSLFFSPYNSFLLDKKELFASAMQSFPEIKALENQSKTYDELNLKLKLREPKLLICDIKADEDTCFLADKSGFIYKTAKDSIGEYTKIYLDKELLDQSNTKKTFIKSKLQEEDLENINFIVKKLKEFGFTLVKIEFTRKAEILAYTDKFFIKLRKDNLNNLDYLFFAKEKELLDFDNLLYIDLRFKSKIYYKELEYEKEG